MFGRFINRLTWREIVTLYVATPAAMKLHLPLFATGLGVLALLGWRRKRKAAAAA